MPKNFPIRYEVKGGSQFPLDMLRYDRAWPESEEDCREISSSLIGSYIGMHSNRKITLSSHKEPTIERWESFLWKVRRL